MTNLDYTEKLERYTYLLEQQAIRCLQDYELKELDVLEEELKSDIDD